MLDWSDTIVAEGRWISSDPTIQIHGIPLGQDFMKLWVDAAIVPGAYLFRPNYAMLTRQEAVGSTVAWPSQKVIPRGIYFVIYILVYLYGKICHDGMHYFEKLMR